MAKRRKSWSGQNRRDFSCISQHADPIIGDTNGSEVNKPRAFNVPSNKKNPSQVKDRRGRRRGMGRSVPVSQLVTFGLESGNFIRFEPNTGAQCNVIPLYNYNERQAVEDGETLQNCPWGEKIKVIGQVRILVLRDEFSTLPNSTQQRHPPDLSPEGLLRHEHHPI